MPWGYNRGDERRMQKIEAVAGTRSLVEIVADAMDLIMNQTTLLQVSCRLWLAAPEQRRAGYALLEEALHTVEVDHHGKPTPLVLGSALGTLGWNEMCREWKLDMEALDWLFQLAFPCQFLTTDPGNTRGWTCEDPCRADWHRWPDSGYLQLAIAAVLNPEPREAIAAHVQERVEHDQTQKGRPATNHRGPTAPAPRHQRPSAPAANRRA